jgi:xanthine dehydrogenase YagR molybdenum-binding subunit
MDPVEFRIRNDTQVDPENPKRPFSRRALVQCCTSVRTASAGGAQSTARRQKREGRWLVGMGVAAAIRNNVVQKSAARVRLDNRGIVTVETDMTDIGTGSYTIIAQTAAEMMGVPLDKVVVRLGDSELSGVVRLRRAIRRQQLHLGRLRGLRQAARSGGAEARLQRR